jgi:hypothetical protein
LQNGSVGWGDSDEKDKRKKIWLVGSVADPDPDFLFPDPDTDSQFSSRIRIQRFISKNQFIPANSLAK